MAKASVIKLPNGIIIEVSSNLTPDQITAMITAVTATNSTIVSPTNSITEERQTGVTYETDLSPEEIWQSSKRERVALFIRWAFTEDLWFTARDVLDEQLTQTSSIVLGETSAIATYLARLFENGYLDRQKGSGRKIRYRMTEKLTLEYPKIELEQFNELLTLEFNH